MFELQYHTGGSWTYHSIHKTEDHAKFVLEGLVIDSQRPDAEWRIVQLDTVDLGN